MYVQSNDIVAYECSLIVNLDNDSKIIVDMNKCWNLRNVPVDVTTSILPWSLSNHGEDPTCETMISQDSRTSFFPEQPMRCIVD